MRSCCRPCPRPASFHQPAGSICSTFSLTGGCPYPTTSSWFFHDRLFFFVLLLRNTRGTFLLMTLRIFNGAFFCAKTADDDDTWLRFTQINGSLTSLGFFSHLCFRKGKANLMKTNSSAHALHLEAENCCFDDIFPKNRKKEETGWTKKIHVMEELKNKSEFASYPNEMWKVNVDHAHTPRGGKGGGVGGDLSTAFLPFFFLSFPRLFINKPNTFSRFYISVGGWRPSKKSLFSLYVLSAFYHAGPPQHSHQQAYPVYSLLYLILFWQLYKSLFFHLLNLFFSPLPSHP